MKKIKGLRYVIGMLFCLIALLCACGSNQEEIVEITLIHGWGSTREDHVAMRQIYQDFEKEHPEIRLNLISMPSSTDVIHKTSDLLTIGKTPDIIFTGGEGGDSVYRFMVEKGYAVDLMPYIEADESFSRNISPFIIENWTTEEGNLYTVSDVLLMGGYWYNEEIFKHVGIESPPFTWNDWITMCDKIQDYNEKTGENIAPFVLDVEHVSYLATVIQADEDMDTLEKIHLEGMDVHQAHFSEVLEQMELVTKYARLESDFNYLDTLACFNKGETAVYINGVWANTMIDSDLDVSYSYFPSHNGKGISTRSACVGYILGNTKDERRIEASIEFIKYMLSDDVAVRILESTGQVTSNPNIDITQVNVSERMEQAINCVQSAELIIETPENLWNMSKKEAYGKALIQYLKGEISIENFIKIVSEMQNIYRDK